MYCDLQFFLLQKLCAEAEELKNKGNNFFKSAEYVKATVAYTEGLQTCPLAFDNDRAILYANRAAAKMKYMVIYYQGVQ